MVRCELVLREKEFEKQQTPSVCHQKDTKSKNAIVYLQHLSFNNPLLSHKIEQPKSKHRTPLLCSLLIRALS